MKKEKEEENRGKGVSSLIRQSTGQWPVAKSLLNA